MPEQNAAPTIESTTCQQCGRFEAEFDDPTWDESIPAKYRPERPLRICELCAASNIERDMHKVVN